MGLSSSRPSIPDVKALMSHPLTSDITASPPGSSDIKYFISTAPEPVTAERLVDAVANTNRSVLVLVESATENTSLPHPSGAALWPRGEAAGRCFAVYPKPWILALDCDNAGAAELVFALRDDLSQAGVDAVVVASGGPGRLHLFARVDDPVLRDEVTGRARSGGIDVRAKTPIRPPGMRHRSGALPVLLTHRSWEAAAEALEHRTTPQPRLKGRAWRLLTKGDVERRYLSPDTGEVDPSRMFLALTSMAHSQSVPKESFWRLCQNEENLGAASIHKRRRRNPSGVEARAFFDRTWSTASQGTWVSHGTVDRNEALVENARLRDLIDDLPWPGQTGPSDAAVLDGVLAIVATHGGLEGPASIRDIALASGKACVTVRRALKALSVAGWLTKTGQHYLDNSDVWLVHEPAQVEHTGAGAGQEERGTGSKLRDLGAGHDGFARGAAGSNGYLLLRRLGGRPSTVNELAASLGQNHRAVRRKLRSLRDDGLVTELDDGTWVVACVEAELSDRLVEVAEKAGHNGRATRRRERFDKERQEFRDALVRMAELLAAAERGERPLPNGLRRPGFIGSRGWNGPGEYRRSEPRHVHRAGARPSAEHRLWPSRP